MITALYSRLSCFCAVLAITLPSLTRELTHVPDSLFTLETLVSLTKRRQKRWYVSLLRIAFEEKKLTDILLRRRRQGMFVHRQSIPQQALSSTTTADHLYFCLYNHDP